jgi:hypothetical protein
MSYPSGLGALDARALARRQNIAETLANYFTQS